jgi:hypothetical protein
MLCTFPKEMLFITVIHGRLTLHTQFLYDAASICLSGCRKGNYYTIFFAIICFAALQLIDNEKMRLHCKRRQSGMP